MLLANLLRNWCSVRGTKFSIKAPTTGKPEKAEERLVLREDELFMGKAAQARKIAAAAGGRKRAEDMSIFETALHNKGQVSGVSSKTRMPAVGD